MVCSVRSAVEILQQLFEKHVSNLAKRKALVLHGVTKYGIFPHLQKVSGGSTPEKMPLLLVAFLALLPARRMTLAVNSGLAWRLAAPAAERALTRRGRRFVAIFASFLHLSTQGRSKAQP